jgi:4'-phosphopantetheinyl transferase
MLPLSSEEVHLWFVACDDITDAELLARYRRLLTPEERAQELRFHFPIDRHRFLLTRALVRTALSRYVPIAPEDWIFVADSHGRPRISNKHPEHAAALADISFNISHTLGLVLFGITGRSALGVDTENVRERVAAVELADRYFSPSEAHSLRALPGGLQPGRFFDYWTLKESYIKARGLGLSIPLDQFSFRIEAGELSLAIRPELDDRLQPWNVWLIRPSAQHIAAICAQSIGPTCQRLVARSVVPLVSEEPLHYVQIARNV